jgi:uncharacterized protein
MHRAQNSAARGSAGSRARGGATARGFFLSTDGGTVGEGQAFEYDPEAETVKLIYDSQSQAECENPDNITVTPRGGLLLCEDNSGATTNSGERMLGLTLSARRDLHLRDEQHHAGKRI